MGNTSFGSGKPELEVGDYLAQIMGVELGQQDDFKNPAIKKDAFIFDVALQMPTGEWDNRKVYTSRVITNMNSKPPPQPQFVSGLNKLIRACGQPVPQTEEAVEAWSERSLVNSRFVWRVQEDPQTGAKVRIFLPLAPAAPVAPVAAPPASPAAPAPAGSGHPAPNPAPAPQAFAAGPAPSHAEAVVEAQVSAPGYDPFANQ